MKNLMIWFFDEISVIIRCPQCFLQRMMGWGDLLWLL